jgi:hypothetical protein
MGGGTNQLAIVGISLSLLSASAIAGYFLMTKGTSSKSQNSSPVIVNQPQTDEESPTRFTSADGREINLVKPLPAPPGQSGLDGRYSIKYGSLSLAVDASSCDKNWAWFDESASNDNMVWNIRSVPGYEGVYTIESQDRIFQKGCENAFLTVSSNCGQVSLESPGLKDRQYWRLIADQVKGGYFIQSVHCYNRRQNSFMISSGVTAGTTNTPRFTQSASAAYNLIPAS